MEVTLTIMPSPSISTMTKGFSDCGDQQVPRVQRGYVRAYKSALILLQILVIHRLLGLPCGFALNILLILRGEGLVLLAQVLIAGKQLL